MMLNFTPFLTKLWGDSYLSEANFMTAICNSHFHTDIECFVVLNERMNDFDFVLKSHLSRDENLRLGGKFQLFSS